MKKFEKTLPIVIAVAVVACGLSFYGGTRYGGGKSSARLGTAAGGFQQFQNLSPEERQQRLEQMGGARSGGLRGGTVFGASGGLRPLSGEVVSASDSSLTVKLSDSSSKVVLLAASTSINKSVAGTVEDLTEGESVMVIGTENSDGSYTASNIQLGQFSRGEMLMSGSLGAPASGSE